MRMNRRDLVLVVVGSLGIAGAASAHPFDRGERPERTTSGAVPERFIRTEIAIQAVRDGRGDTGGFEREHRSRAFDTPQSERDRPSTLRAPELPVLPIASAIRNRIELGDSRDGEKKNSLEQNSATPSESQHHGKNTYRAPSNQAPVPLKRDIMMKCLGGDDSLVEPVVRPDDSGYGHGGRMSDADDEPAIGDASQASLRNPRTYGPLGRDVPSPAAMFMKGAIKMRMQGSGGGEQSDEK